MYKCPQCGYTNVGKDFADKIERYRATNDMSKVDFAKKIGASWLTVHRWENGVTPHHMWQDKLNGIIK